MPMLTKRIINLSALSLFLALIENFIPRPLPFFRLGLANISMLIALKDFNAKEYFTLSVFKALSTSYISGTLISPFFLLSLSQSIASSFLMYASYKTLKEKISVYGISLIGALTSTIVQIALASLMLGRGIFSFLSIMLIISFCSAFITAFISKKINFDYNKDTKDNGRTDIKKGYGIILFLIILIAVSLENIASLITAFVFTIIMNCHMGGKFKPLNYIVLILVCTFSALITPRGEVLARIFGFPITALSLSEGIQNGLRLSLLMALSLSLSKYLIKGGAISSILNKFFIMESSFYTKDGALLDSVKHALNADEVDNVKENSYNIPYFTSILILIVLSALKFIEISFL